MTRPPICTKCGRDLNCEKNGIVIEDLFCGGKSYKMTHGDLWKCPVCGVEIICNVSDKPLAEHYEKDYPKHSARIRKDFQTFKVSER